ncbi:MAG: ribose 5-phosphate isomerase B [Defluviitaleaceae bacterium]|nr:ribose 5-phosphate isomerase B [Defluviitaleaceae bacterium]
MKLVIAYDHTALEMKAKIAAYLITREIEVLDICADTGVGMEYPIAGYKAATLVASGQADGAVLICGTGVGISLAANKVRGIRACVCSEPYSARMSRAHNDSNVIVFGARVVGIEMAKAIVDAWLDTPFEGDRHAHRVALINQIDETGALES